MGVLPSVGGGGVWDEEDCWLVMAATLDLRCMFMVRFIANSFSYVHTVVDANGPGPAWIDIGH